MLLSVAGRCAKHWESAARRHSSLNAPLIRDISTSTLIAEVTARVAGDLVRDASPSELELILATVYAKRVQDTATARAGMRIADITPDVGASPAAAEEQVMGID